MPYLVELTDTFAGEANYCWVRRATLPSSITDGAEYGSLAYRRRLARAALESVGESGSRGRWYWNGPDDGEWRPYGRCVVLFVRWTDTKDDE